MIGWFSYISKLSYDKRNKMKVKDILIAIFVVFAWGSYFTVSKVAFLKMPPILLNAIRYFLMFLITSPFLFKEKIPTKKIALISVVLSLDLIVISYAIKLSSNLTPIILINQLSIPIASFLAIYILKETFKIRYLIGTLISLIGIAMVLNFKSFAFERANLQALVLALLAAILFAYYNLCAKCMTQFNILSLIANISLWVLPQFLCFSFFFEDWSNAELFSVSSFIPLLYIVVVISLLGYYLWFNLLNKYTMNEVLPFMLLMPVFGCITSSIVYNEKIEIRELLGIILVVLGLTVIELKVKVNDQKKS